MGNSYVKKMKEKIEGNGNIILCCWEYVCGKNDDGKIFWRENYICVCKLL